MCVCVVFCFLLFFFLGGGVVVCFVFVFTILRVGDLIHSLHLLEKKEHH